MIAASVATNATVSVEERLVKMAKVLVDNSQQRLRQMLTDRMSVDDVTEQAWTHISNNLIKGYSDAENLDEVLEHAKGRLDRLIAELTPRDRH